LKLIVGLGNPGKEYEATRHNVGFEVIDILAHRHAIHVRSRRGRALVGEGFIEGHKVMLVKPMTFMNLSGQAVGALARHYRLEPSDVLVIYDDINLPLGKLRIRARGSAGGHNGLDSIIHTLGTQEFARVRVGVGSPAQDAVRHVLSRFRKSERIAIREAFQKAADAVEEVLSSDIEKAMNLYNTSSVS
jgi:peptidyl-tRNA hydrolase, PTH1 family